MTYTSFGEYFDAQREKKRKIHESFDKELRECSETGIEISQECKTYFKKRFEWARRNP